VPLAETDLSGNTVNEYIFFAGGRIARRDSAGNVYYCFGEHLGSSRSITNGTGTICYEGDFYPFGGERVITNTCGQNYKFAGMERDSETGEDHTWFRYYASNLGRWLSPDPVAGSILNPQSFNRYAYVLNSPTNLTDPLGLWCHPDDPQCQRGGTGGAEGCALWGMEQDPVTEQITWVCVMPSGGGGGGGTPTVTNPSQAGPKQELITETLKKLQECLPLDIVCLSFLGGQSALDALGAILQLNLYGHAEIRTKEGDAYSIGAVTSGGVVGQAITVNRLGLFYSAFPGGRKDLDVGGYAGGTGPARALILLHELGHVTDVLRHDLNAPDVSKANTETVKAKCEKTLSKF